MKENLTIYHFKKMIDYLNKNKLGTKLIFKDLATALNVSEESFDAFKESLSSGKGSNIDKKHVWSVDVTDEVIKKLSHLGFKTKTILLGNMSGDFLLKLYQSEQNEYFTGISCFTDSVFSVVIEDEFKNESWREMWMSVLKKKMGDSKDRSEIPFLTKMLNMDNEKSISSFLIEADFTYTLEDKYIYLTGVKDGVKDGVITYVDDNVKDFFSALNSKEDCLKKKYNENNLDVLLRKTNISSSFTNDGYKIYIKGLSALSQMKECNSDWRAFDFIKYVDEIVSHKSIEYFSIKFNRELDNQEKDVFDAVVKNLIVRWDIDKGEILDFIEKASSKMNLMKMLNDSEKQQKDSIPSSGESFKL